MATLVLTTVGTAIGGPIGGAIGAVIGQAADAAIFAPKPRQGPRLGELAVQTSSYGTAIPKIFGRMRVAGTVIWATDLKERRSTSGGGKGSPKTTSYSYSASFAVALSGRPIAGVRRIWADGKLLRGASGDFKSKTRYRLYRGSEDQAPDPMIASVEGVGRTPAFRGLAYAMFEDFQLADFGNRIPSLTFEVEADAGPVSIGAVADELSAGAVRAGDTPSVDGYAAGGSSVRGAIEALGDVVPLSLVEQDGLLRITTERLEPHVLEAAETGARGRGRDAGRTELHRRAAGSVPDEVSIAYHDAARDYQTGLQRATRGGPGLRADRRALPAVLGADAAKSFAEQRLAALWAGRVSAKLHLPWRRSDVRPGRHVRLEGQAGLWRVERWALDWMVVSLELVRVATGALAPAAGASAGRPIGHPDLPHGPTSFWIFELPFDPGQEPPRPRLMVAAAGAQAGWRRAELMASFDGGGSWQNAGATGGASVAGTVLEAPGPGASALFDARNSIVVELLNSAMWLESRDDAALVAGANLALVGDELIQFGHVEVLGQDRFRLSRLLRGRRGTEHATSRHSQGARFVLIEQQSLAVIEPPVEALGGEARIIAQGLGDSEEGVSASAIIAGEAMRPPSPVHLAAVRAPNGDVDITWVRRSRSGWSWLDGSDTPIGEESERYRVSLACASGERVATVAVPQFLYSVAQQVEDGFTGSLEIAVTQLGTAAASRPALLTINLQEK